MVVAAPPPRQGFPFGFAALLVATLMLYAVTTATVLDSRSSDAAGNALSQAFAAILGGLLWIAIIVLLAMARARGAMVRWAPWALFVLVPASVVAYFIAIGSFDPKGGPAQVVVYALPPLAVLFAVWARFSGLHNTLRPAGTSSTSSACANCSRGSMASMSCS